MSKEIKDINETIMNKIHEGKIKMRPKFYFIIGSFLTLFGIIFSSISSMFVFGLIRFSIRSHGPRSDYRIEKMISDFPWWLLFIAIFAVIIGIWLIRKYDFAYKINFKIIILVFSITIIMSGIIFDIIGINDLLSSRGPIKNIMHKYIKDSNFDYNLESKWVPGIKQNPRYIE